MSLRFLTAGESHGPELVVIVDGLPAGLRLDSELIASELGRRQGGYGRGARSTKIERDRAEIVAGRAAGMSTGAPIAMRIVNRDFANQPAQRAPMTTPRPGHADLAGAEKFGLADLRWVRERASARETAARVAAGAVVRPLLAAFGIELGSFVTSIGEVEASVELEELDGHRLRQLHQLAEADPVRCPHAGSSSRMVAAIDTAREGRSTLGGTFVVFASGAPAGLGSHTQWDLRLDGRIAQAICAIQAVKAAELGPALKVARQPGELVQDPLREELGGLRRASNFAGGLEGGMTNGEPVVVRAAMKPLSSVRAPLISVNLASGEVEDPPYVRSDVCAVPAAAVVGEAALAWVLACALVERFGGDRLDAMLAAREQVRANPFPGLRP